MRELEHEDLDRERDGQFVTAEWAKSRERIEERHLRGVVEVEEDECGVRGGQGRKPVSLVRAAAVVGAALILAGMVLAAAVSL